MRLAPAFALVALAALVGACDHAHDHDDPGCRGPRCTPYADPLAVDYDTVAFYDYEARVRPLLAARNLLSPVSTPERGNPAAYPHAAVLAAGPSGFVVPFDSAGSHLVRMIRDLPADAAIPLPNLRRMEPDEVRFLQRWIADGARGPDGQPGFHAARQLLYACVQGENHLAILDAETLRIIRRVSFDRHGLPSAPHGPHHVAFEPGGGAAYVSLISAGRVVKLSTSLTLDPNSPAYRLGVTAPGAMTYPGMLALDATSGRLYVGRSTLAPDLSIRDFYVVDRTAMSVETVETPPGFTLPHAMAVTPDGRFALTASLTGNRIAVYDPASGDLMPTDLPASTPPRELIHLSPLGSTYPMALSLTSRTTDEVLMLSLTSAGSVSLTGSVPAGRGPYHAHTTNDGRTILVPNWFGDTVTLVDAATRQPTLTVPTQGVLARPHSPAPSHDGARFFVSSSNLVGSWAPPLRFRRPDGSATEPRDWGNVAAFTMAGQLVGVVQLGAYPSGLEPFTVGSGGHTHP